MPYKTKDGEELSLNEVKSRFNLSAGDALDADIMEALELTFVEPTPEVESLIDIKTRKNREINGQWQAADLSVFEFQGKLVSMDTASRHRLDSIFNFLLSKGSFPSGFTGSWKAVDNSLIPMPDSNTFEQMYAAMVEAQTANFIRAQTLKEEVIAATTSDAVASISWNQPTSSPT